LMHSWMASNGALFSPRSDCCGWSACCARGCARSTVYTAPALPLCWFPRQLPLFVVWGISIYQLAYTYACA
jgi:hypothetical protein